MPSDKEIKAAANAYWEANQEIKNDMTDRVKAALEAAEKVRGDERNKEFDMLEAAVHRTRQKLKALIKEGK